MADEMRASLWTSKQLAKAIPGTEKGGSFSCRGISIDSRTIEPGQAYLALKGTNFDGHDFVSEAVKKGATGVIVQQLQIINHPQIIVGDSHLALWKIAQKSRSAFKGSVVAITGSVGKTSLKDMLQFAYSDDGLAFSTPANNNNHIGVPLAWANCPEGTTSFFIELGMSIKGEISSLSQLSKPDISVITTVGKAHMMNFSDKEDILKAKLEILNGMKPKSTLIVFRDSEKLFNTISKASVAKKINVIDVGYDSKSRIRVFNVEASYDKITFGIMVEDEEIQSTFSGFGDHWINLIALVVAIGKKLGKDYRKAVNLLQNYQPQKGRGQYFKTIVDNKNISILDESYNASPESMSKMIDTIGKVVNSRKLLVLGEMLELGKITTAEHKKIAIYCKKSSIDIVFCSGEKIQCLVSELEDSSVKVYYEDNLESLKERIVENIMEDDFIAIKGSKLVNLGEIVEFFRHSRENDINKTKLY